MTTPADILIPIPANEIPVNRKPRWFQIVVYNPVGAFPSMNCMGEYVDLNGAGDVVSTPSRNAELDLTVAYDPNDPDHAAFYALGDKIVKKAYAAKLASPPVLPQTTAFPITPPDLVQP